MGKRSNFERKPRDFYSTPESAVLPLLKRQPPFNFNEPCAGDGALVRILTKHGFHCWISSDIEPQDESVTKMDAFQLKSKGLIITNPPWDRKILHPLIEHFISIDAPAWLLLDADWSHTKQAEPYMAYCREIVSVGRVKWIPDSKMQGKDNCAWYLFLPTKVKETIFVGRTNDKA